MIGPWKRAIEAEGHRTVALARCANLEGQLTEAHGVIRELTQMIRDQVGQIVDMRREGFNPPPAQPLHEPKGPDIPDMILDVMAEQAEPGSTVWSGIEREVRKMQAKGLAPHEIADHVRNGVEFQWED